jgi:hypothetical protein
METFHLVVALSSGIAASLALVMPFFGKALKEELEVLSREKAELKAAAERFEKRLLEKDKKLQKLRECLETAENEAETERRKARGQRGDGRKVQELEQDFHRKEELLERRLAVASEALKEVQAELLEQKQKVAKMGEEVAIANADTAAAKSALARAEAKPAPVAPAPIAAAPATEPATAPAPGLTEEIATLRQAVAKLKKDLKIRSHGEKTIKRKLEHNRRAYMVTMMQLDLANDELCLIKTGKPRRQTALVRSQIPGAVPEPTDEEPETVEELLEELPPEVEAVIDLTEETPTETKPAVEITGETEEEVAEVVEEAPAEEAAEVVEEAPAEEAAEVVEEAPAEEAAEVVEEAPAEEAAEVIEEAPAEEEIN